MTEPSASSASPQRMSPERAASERHARRLYVWLLLSSLITVPWMVLDRPRAVPPEHSYNMEPTWSPDGRYLAFTSGSVAMDSDFDIYVINADGTGVRNLTASPNWDQEPAWSPDGRFIAFSSYRSGDSEIYVMAADGTDLRRLTYNPGDDEHPAWSPDGRSVAFERGGKVYLMNSDGTGQQNLTRNSALAQDPAWSPDGGSIAYTALSDKNFEIFVADADGTNPRDLTNHPADDTGPIWSPDGKRIAFMSERDGGRAIYIMGADGSEPRRLTELVGFGFANDWSPDGQQIAFCSNADIFTVNLDGSGLRQLTPGLWQPPIWEYVAAVLAPVLVHLLLFLGFLSPYPYARRHTQQAMGLALLRALCAAILMGLTRYSAVNAWLVVNGSLWLFGSIWGLRQVSRGDCWLMRVRGEGAALPRPWAVAVPKGEAAPPPAQVPTAAVSTVSTVSTVPTGPQAAFDQGLALLSQDKREAAVACFMTAFRLGDADLRRRALAELETLGEVEKG
jgi:hypothetical protein